MATLTEEDPSETPVIQPRGRKRLLSGDNTENTGPSPKAIARSEETGSDKSESEEEENGRKAKHPKLVRGSESHRYWSFVPLDTTETDGREQIEVKDELPGDEASTK